jgi:phosphoenolpyruvate---glycerone phosphotransferase subunit DhaM
VVVSLVLVSHSPALLVALREMIDDASPAPVALHLAGGTDDGRLGTSVGRIADALRAAASPDGTVVLYDSGSAWLAITFALEELPVEAQRGVAVTDAPLVEGSMAAAAMANRSAPLDEVMAAADAALRSEKRPPDKGGMSRKEDAIDD